MGFKQILLIILSIILIAGAIYIGLQMYNKYKIEAHQDAIIADIMRIADAAYKYRIESYRGSSGIGLYSGFSIPPDLELDKNTSYQIDITDDGRIITITGLSSLIPRAKIFAHYDLQLNYLVSADSSQAPSILSPGKKEHYFFKEGW